MTYRSKYFKIEELVAPEILAVLSAEAAWLLIPQSVQMDLDQIRSSWGKPIGINAKGRKYCGVRPVNCPEGAVLSRHKLVEPGVFAWDLHTKNLAGLTDLVKAKHREFGVIRMEDPAVTTSWLHIEITTDMQPGDLHIFKP